MNRDIRDVDFANTTVTVALIEDALEYLKGALNIGPADLGDGHRTYNLGAFTGYMVAFGLETTDVLEQHNGLWMSGPMTYAQAKLATMPSWDDERVTRHLWVSGLLRGYREGIVECFDNAVCTNCDRGLRSDSDTVMECEDGFFCNGPTRNCFDEFDHNAACRNDRADHGWEKP